MRPWGDDSTAEALSGIRSRLGTITAALSASVLGVSFLDNPEGFVVASLINWVLGFLDAVVGRVAVILRSTIYGTLADVLARAGAAALAPFGAAGDVALDLLDGAEAFVVDLAAQAGPFGPVVIVLALVDLLLQNVELLLPLVSSLRRLSERIGFLPTQTVETLFTVLLVVAVARYIGRLIAKTADSE